MDETIKFFMDNMKKRKKNDFELKQIKWVILDSVVAMVHGKTQTELSMLASNFMDAYPSGELKDSGAMIAFRNGVAMVSEELDEGNPLAKGHPACHFLPSLIVSAVRSQKNGYELIEAFHASYELSARLGSTVQLREEVHPHGNWGGVGGAFAHAYLFNWSEIQTARGISIAAGLSFSNLWASVLEGHRLRDICIGFNNLIASMVPSLVASGYSGGEQTISLIFGKILGNSWDQEKFLSLVRDEKLYIMHTYFKFHPYCRFCHSPIDLMLTLLDKVKLQQIEQITFWTYSLAARLNKKDVDNDFSGMFSIPYAVAKSAITYTSSDPIDDTSVKRLAKKINVYEDRSYTDLLPKCRKTRIEILDKNGYVYQEETVRAKGDPDELNLEKKLIEKWKRLLTDVMSYDEAMDLIERILNLENESSVEFIMSYMKKGF